MKSNYSLVLSAPTNRKPLLPKFSILYQKEATTSIDWTSPYLFRKNLPFLAPPNHHLISFQQFNQ